MSSFDRRLFLKSSGLSLIAGGLLPNVFVRMAGATTLPASASKRVLVAIFQRGAVDGLNLLVPYGEKVYYDARPSIAVPRPGAGERAALDLDGFFGLHPSLAPLLPHFRDRSAAFVHAVGSPDSTRSHFDAQDFMESGTPGSKSTRDGFLARAIGASRPANGGAPSPLRAVAMTPGMPRILSGSDAIAMTSLSGFGIRAGQASEPLSESFESMYEGAVAGTLQATARESFEAVHLVRSADPNGIPVANGAAYPRGPLGSALRQISQLIKSDVGLEVAFT
ncbi:MAG TPA: hypothetical protein VGK26_06125, partial [Thermoanaerobaculia bacterium]